MLLFGIWVSYALLISEVILDLVGNFSKHDNPIKIKEWDIPRGRFGRPTI